VVLTVGESGVSIAPSWCLTGILLDQGAAIEGACHFPGTLLNVYAATVHECNDRLSHRHSSLSVCLPVCVLASTPAFLGMISVHRWMSPW